MKIPQIYLIFLRLFSITTWITVFARDLLSIILYWAYYSQGVTASRPPWISKRLPTSSAAGALNYDRWGRDLQAPSQAGHGKWHGQRASGQTQLLITLISGYANIVNPKNHCYLNSVIQLLLPILRTIIYDFQFNSSTEGTLSKYMLETAYNAYSSTDVDVLKFQLVQYNQFYDGKNQQDSSECLLMLIEIINKGSVPYYGSHVSNSTGVFLSDILFSFMLEKYIVCNVCGLRSPSIESSGVLYISPTHTSSMQELIMQGLQQKLEKSCFRCNKNTWHVESNHILQPPNYLIIVVNRFRYINNQFAKDKCSIPMDMTVVLGYHKFSLQATIDHHGPSIYSGHYTTSVNCCNRTFYCNDNKITEFDMINTKNSSTAYVVIYKLIT